MFVLLSLLFLSLLHTLAFFLAQLCDCKLQPSEPPLNPSAIGPSEQRHSPACPASTFKIYQVGTTASPGILSKLRSPSASHHARQGMPIGNSARSQLLCLLSLDLEQPPLSGLSRPWYTEGSGPLPLPCSEHLLVTRFLLDAQVLWPPHVTTDKRPQPRLSSPQLSACHVGWKGTHPQGHSED